MWIFIKKWNLDFTSPWEKPNDSVLVLRLCLQSWLYLGSSRWTMQNSLKEKRRVYLRTAFVSFLLSPSRATQATVSHKTLFFSEVSHYSKDCSWGLPSVSLQGWLTEGFFRIPRPCFFLVFLPSPFGWSPSQTMQQWHEHFWHSSSGFFLNKEGDFKWLICIWIS